MNYYLRNSHVKFWSDPEIQISLDLIDRRWEAGTSFTFADLEADLLTFGGEGFPTESELMCISLLHLTHIVVDKSYSDLWVRFILS